jgi:Outer membrane lipoprotein-sorting protein
VKSSLVMRLSLLSFTLLLCFPIVTRADDVQSVLTRMRNAIAPGKDMRADFTMDMSNENGEISRWAGQYFRRGGSEDGLRLVFDSPLDLRGTAVTARVGADGKEHLRMFLPWIRRTRDLQGDMRGESFLGSDFNFEDLGLEHLDDWENELQADGKAGNRSCYTLVSKPSQGWWYGKVVRCIDKKTFLPLRTEYYDRANILWKVRSYDDIDTISGHPTAISITMRTIPTKTATTLTFKNVAFDTGLSAGLFTQP